MEAVSTLAIVAAVLSHKQGINPAAAIPEAWELIRASEAFLHGDPQAVIRATDDPALLAKLTEQYAGDYGWGKLLGYLNYGKARQATKAKVSDLVGRIFGKKKRRVIAELRAGTLHPRDVNKIAKGFDKAARSQTANASAARWPK